MLNTNFLLHLTLIEGIGPHIIQKIMQNKRSDVQTSDLYHVSASDWMRYFGLTELAAQKLAAGLSDMAILEKELELIEKHKIQLLTIADELYPALLKEIHLPPVVLYYQGSNFDEFTNPSIHAFGALPTTHKASLGTQGNLCRGPREVSTERGQANGEREILNEKSVIHDKNLYQSSDILSSVHFEYPTSVRPECAEGVYRRVVNKRIAIVGARKGNEYGQRIINTIIPDLVAAGYTIVSGGALGIDTMAHEAALACGGKTIAILGSGLLKPYPSANKKLFAAIVESGGIVASSYPLMMDSLPQNFPARNRIVTGLSQGCLVVQAAKKSGALISAHCALEQGREVFAVPGLFDDELSVGCHEIIQQGAKLVMSSADIFNEFGDRIIQVDKQVLVQQALFTANSSVKDELSLSARPECPKGVYRRMVVVNEKYSDTQQKIIAACKQPMSLEDIMSATQLSFEHVQSELFTLQLDGVVSQDFTGMWLLQ